MPNLRILSDNAANRATLAASTTAGTLVANNLLSDLKSVVWRSTALSASITATWASSELVGCVALPFCNLTATATIRVRGYTLAGDASPAFDTGTQLAAPYAPFGMWNWGTVSLGVNAFAYGGGTYGSIWFPIAPVQKLVIDLSDAANVAGYIECSRLVTGTYWTPAMNADYGALATPEDTSKQYRTDAGDMLTDIGTQAKKVSIQLNNLSPIDRSAFWRIVRGSGLTRPIFVSLFPENSADPELEQTHQVYGRLSSMSALTAASYNIYSAPCEIEEN